MHPYRSFELRCLNAKTRGVPRNASGIFDNPEAAAKAARGYDGNYKGLYFTLNPTSRPVTNRLGQATETTSDNEVPHRHWLLIDVEGTRPNAKECNATDTEVLAAIELACDIAATVDQAAPLVLCSGNGCHLLYSIDLPNTEDARELCKRALAGLATRYDNEGATIDPKVFNAARISKLAGTLTRKGEHTEDRPQRYSFVLDWGVEGVLPVATLEVWASWAPTKEQAQPVQSTSKGVVANDDRVARARKWLEKRDPAVSGAGGDDWTYQTACEVMIDFDLAEQDALTLLGEWNRRCQPPWDEEDLSGFLRRAEKYSTKARGSKLAIKPAGWTDDQVGAQDERLNGFAWTDLGNARALIYLYGERLRWCTTSRKWYVWTGTHWMDDGKNKALAWANKTALKRLAAAELIQDEDEKKKAKAYHRAGQGNSRRNNTLEQVKAWVPNVIESDDLDKNNWLLNCKNGTLDLRTCQLQRHNQADYITNLVGADYDPTATCPKWMAFLNRVMLGDQDMISYLQRAIGYSLTGDTREQCLFLCYGGGKNGKSVFLEVIGKILAGYSCQSGASTFAESKGSEKIPNDIAKLKGKRLVRCVETDEKLAFNEGLVKQMTGSDTLTARFLRAEWFEFRPAFKLWFATNHKPTIRGSDNGIWRRMRLIPWQVQIPDEEVDLDLQDKLAAEAEGILAWAVAGCQEWLRGGIREPETVRRETEEYRDEQDIIGQWIQECCDTGPCLRDTTSILYKYFCIWAKEKRIWEGNEVIFARRLGSKGFAASKGSGGARCRVGIRVNLNTRSEDPVEPSPALDQAARTLIDGFDL